MSALPVRANLAGTPDNATAAAAMGAQYDFLLDRLGSDAGAAPVTVASAATPNLDAVTTVREIVISGTTAITSFVIGRGKVFLCKASAAFTLTNGSALVTNTGANIVCVAGDSFVLRATANNEVEVLLFTRSAGGSAASTTTPGIVELATTAETATGTDAARAVTPEGLANSSRVALATAVVSTGGTSIDFTGIPSFARRITVEFAGVSLSGSALPLIQIGPSGGIETSSYKSICTAIGGSAQSATNGFVIGIPGGADGNTHHGSYVISLVTGNAFVGSGVLGILDANTTNVLGGGSKTLAGTLTQLRITTTNGTDTFDAGTVNISWE